MDRYIFSKSSDKKSGSLDKTFGSKLYARAFFVVRSDKFN